MYTDQQIRDYTAKLAAANATPEDIEAFVRTAKQEQTPQPAQQFPTNTGNPVLDTAGGFFNNNLWAKSFADTSGNTLNTINQGVYSSTAQPVLNAAAGVPVTAYKDVQGAGKALADLPTAVQQSGGDWNKQVQVPFSQENINQNATAPVTLPWGIGNVNWNVAGQNGQMDLPRTVINEAAHGVDAASGVANIVAPGMTKPTWLQSFGTGFVRGGAQSAAKSLERDIPDPSVSLGSAAGNAAGWGALGGTTTGIMAGMPNILDKIRNARAGAAGLEDYQQKALQKPENAADYNQTLEEAKLNKGVTGSRTAADQVGDQIKTTYKTAFKQELSQAGKDLGDAIKATTDSGVKIDTAPIRTQLETMLTDQFQVDLSQDTPDFSGSGFQSDTVGQKHITSLLQWLKDNPSVDPTTLHNKIFDIDNNVLKLSRLLNGQPIGAVKVPLLSTVEDMSNTLKNNLPQEARTLFDNYSDLAGIDKFLGPRLNADKPGSQILQALYNENTPEKLVPALNKLSELSGKDFINQADIAKAVENIADTTKKLPIPRSFSLRSLATRAARGSIANPESAARGLIMEGQGTGFMGLPSGGLSQGNVLPTILQQSYFRSGYLQSHPNATDPEIEQAYNQYVNQQ